jgi:hypothetical protein
LEQLAEMDNAKPKKGKKRRSQRKDESYKPNTPINVSEGK